MAGFEDISTARPTVKEAVARPPWRCVSLTPIGAGVTWESACASTHGVSGPGCELRGMDEDSNMVSRYLRRDSAGVAERLRVKMAESDGKSRTKHGTLGGAEGSGE